MPPGEVMSPRNEVALAWPTWLGLGSGLGLALELGLGGVGLAHLGRHGVDRRALDRLLHQLGRHCAREAEVDSRVDHRLHEEQDL